MRIIKKVPAYKKARKSKLYSKPVRYGIADKSVARMYSDLEKEIFLIERSLESLKYKVRYYSLWDKIVSGFEGLVGKINKITDKIKSFFIVKLDKVYTVDDFIDRNTRQFKREGFKAFFDSLFKFEFLSKNYAKVEEDKVTPELQSLDKSTQQLLESLDQEITEMQSDTTSMNKKQKKQKGSALLSLINDIAQKIVNGVFGFEDKDLKPIQTSGLVEIKHQSDLHKESKEEEDITKKLNKFIKTIQLVDGFLTKRIRNRFILAIVALALFIVALLICYEVGQANLAFLLANVIYFAIGVILTFLFLVYCVILVALAFKTSMKEADSYKNQMANKLTDMAQKIAELEINTKNSEMVKNIKSLFKTQLEAAKEEVEELLEKSKDSLAGEGMVKEKDFKSIYNRHFEFIDNFITELRKVNGQAEVAVAGRSRLIRRKNRIFSSNKHVIKKKLRYR
ncbi:MAG: hypothetical protein QXF12_04605 [Candidatus Aenigmatarchaeota archaeon]